MKELLGTQSTVRIGLYYYFFISLNICTGDGDTMEAGRVEEVEPF